MVETGQEQTWIAQSQQGDESAFENLIRMHQRTIHNITLRMTGSLEDADDLTQETFAQAFRQLAGFRGRSKFSSWLCRVAINTTLNWRRRESRRREVLRLWAVETTSETPPERQSSQINETSQRVQAALDKLPPTQRAAIILTVYQRLNHADAALALGCAETTVSWRVFTARRRLRRLLKKELNEEDQDG